VRFAVTPEVNALSALWILTIFIVLGVGQLVQRKQQ
jgi:ABC-type spermidine/putrescine transport system permease subunit II